MAIRQPWRMALAYAIDAGVDYEGPGQAAVVRRMIAHRINTVMTSSCGRLFDAVAAMAGVRGEVNFEGQAAMELESAAAAGEWPSYPFSIDGGVVDFRQMIAAIARGREGTPVVSARFHATVAAAAVEMCRTIAGGNSLKRVCLSGGSFQNWRLLDLTLRGLRSAGFDVFLHLRVPPNDGGLALGQAMVANAVLQQR
jgi:hydrogenase maturation protein HypF